MTTDTARSFPSGPVTVAADEYPAVGPSKGVVLLLHGGGQTRHSWGAAARRFADADWTSFTVDARGHGDTSWAPEGDYTQEALVGDLQAVVAAVGETPVLVGASMGGMTALLAVGEGAVTARGLVLVDIAPRVEPAGVARIAAFMRAKPEGFADLDEVADAVAAYNPHRPRPKNLEGLKKNVRLGEDGRWHWHWDPAFLRVTDDEPKRLINTDRVFNAAAAVRVPTLIVRGKQSDILSEEGAREVVELIPGSRYVDVGGAGHMVAGDDNDVFGREVLQFLNELAPRS
jgi:pimeloyl-ACP methyl ester carboxylesterase